MNTSQEDTPGLTTCINRSGIVSHLMLYFKCKGLQAPLRSLRRSAELRCNSSAIDGTWPDVVAGVTARLPSWLAPNVITLIGLAGLLAAYILAFVYLPGFEGKFFFP